MSARSRHLSRTQAMQRSRRNRARRARDTMRQLALAKQRAVALRELRAGPHVVLLPPGWPAKGQPAFIAMPYAQHVVCTGEPQWLSAPYEPMHEATCTTCTLRPGTTCEHGYTCATSAQFGAMQRAVADRLQAVRFHVGPDGPDW